MTVSDIFYVGLVMGAVGSLHCVGMCGPLAMSLPMQGRDHGGRLYGGFLYNAGRISTYTLLGLMLGVAGSFLITPNVQSLISIIFGVAILLVLFLPKKAKNFLLKNSPVQAFFMQLRKQLGKLISTPTNASLFSIGMLNGLLPCGMIYLALTSSFLTGSAVKGGLFMASFGLGTFPAMLTVVYFGSYINQHVRLNLRKAVPIFMACMAAMLILRGLSLGIPYLSPSLPHDAVATKVSCH